MAIPYNSNYDLTIPFSDVSVQILLSSSAIKFFTVPGDETKNYSVRFSYTSTSNIFVMLGNSLSDIIAIPPSVGVGTQQYNEFRPGSDGSQRYVKGGDIIYFRTPDTTAYVGLSLRSLN